MAGYQTAYTYPKDSLPRTKTFGNNRVTPDMNHRALSPATGEPEARNMKRVQRLLRFLAVGWFLFALAISGLLIFSDHWIAFVTGLTPLPSLLVPLSLAWSLLLVAFQRQSAPWALAALGIGLVLTPFGIFGIVPWRGSEPTDVAAGQGMVELAIVNSNAGKRDRDQLLEFVETTQPDLIAVQGARLPADAPFLAGLHYAKAERLSLWSRWPITATETIVESDRVFVARFEVAWPPEPLALYVMHLPSPRSVLDKLAIQRMLEPNSRRQIFEYHQRRGEILRTLSGRIANENGLVLLVGDANQPAFGPAYRQLSKNLRDGQLSAGRGFGYTLQNVVNSNLPQFPFAWARIDYVFANQQFAFISHQVEPPHDGHHRALFARLRLVAK